MKVLNKINKSCDVKRLTLEEKKKLSSEIRELIIETTSKNGGHLASNLGVVELTIALHSSFDFPKDKLIFDVGHQCYVHKILTDRKDKFNTLRKMNGLSGFPKPSESIYDEFNTGHSSTSLSLAAGYARARDLNKKKYKVIALIGDGSMTGGMALEALNDIGSSKLDVTVILNDNEMSISKNVGGIPLLLSKLRTRKFYTVSNDTIRNIILRLPLLGKIVINLVKKTKNILKQIFLHNMYFEDLGFTYLGPVDGHNIKDLELILRKSKNIKGPILIHIITKKGKGYKFSEENPSKYHGVGKFDIKTGEKLKNIDLDYSSVFGNKLVELAKENKNIVAVTAAMCEGTGLSEFSKKYPDRFFDVGIAEQHALGLVAGMAKGGLKPVISIYSSFLQRGYDQLIHDIALQDVPAVICVDRAGIVGNDGETHQGIYDLSYLSTIPNMTIIAPKDFKELEDMLEFSINYNHPICIRYPRGGEYYHFDINNKIELGISEVLYSGNDVCIFAIGKMVSRAMEVRNILKEKNIDVEVINIKFLKPIDKEQILKSIKNKKIVITIEDNLLQGGLYSTILDVINNTNVKIKGFGYNDTFVKQGTVEEIENKYGLDANSIARKILKEINKK